MLIIIGGRFGSAASDQPVVARRKFFEYYDSVTQKEFEAAQNADVPTFILVDAAVQSEYRTYSKNRSNTKIKYAHVDSVGVFKLLDKIYEKSKNNPTFSFERATEIEGWLREQWSGLFRELLKSRSQKKQIADLNSQVAELKSINGTLKTYLESVLAKVDPASSEKIINEQDTKLQKESRDAKLSNNRFYKHLTQDFHLNQDNAIKFFEIPSSADEIIAMMQEKVDNSDGSLTSNYLDILAAAQNDYNDGRQILGLPPIDFEKSTSSNAKSTARGASNTKAAIRSHVKSIKKQE